MAMHIRSLHSLYQYLLEMVVASFNQGETGHITKKRAYTLNCFRKAASIPSKLEKVYILLK